VDDQIKFENHNLGKFFKNEKLFVFFGNKNSIYPSLQNDFADLSFQKIKQVHGNNIVHSTSYTHDTQEADAHWTTDPKLALGIVTADCMPIFLWDPMSKTIAGIHAGWRGIANQIFPMTIQKMILNGSRPENLNVFIGPHILYDSFEVDFETRDKILIGLENPHAYYKVSPLNSDRVLVNLFEVAIAQARTNGINTQNISYCLSDTKTDLNYHSYRRDKDQSGRQVSFICLLIENTTPL
jgi:polyphenol oxidase